MGPRFNGVEDIEEAAKAVEAERLQWGHALMAWKTFQKTGFRPHSYTFNGATL